MSANVAIDTCVFLHLFNDGNNPDSHIEQLLNHLFKKRYRLGVDSTQKIANEYTEYLEPIIRNSDETKLQVPILRFWMNVDLRETINVEAEDLLMHRIRQVIHEKDEHADRAFVYVSCKGDCCLITNDGEHILPRRKELRDKTRKLRGNQSQILNSREAVGVLVTAPTVARGD
jgi:hypothetical protein